MTIAEQEILPEHLSDPRERLRVRTAAASARSYAKRKHDPEYLARRDAAAARYRAKPEVKEHRTRQWVIKLDLMTRASPEDRDTITRKKMIYAARQRAKSRGLAFDITADDISIPDCCPVLGIPLRYGVGSGKRGPESPSLDRIDNSRGYVKDNVIVVSWRANGLKTDASVAELNKVASFYSRLAILQEVETLRLGSAAA